MIYNAYEKYAFCLKANGTDNKKCNHYTKALKIKHVVQCRLEFVKAARFGRYILNKLVRWASRETLHSLGRIFIFRETLENKSCGPGSAGIFEGCQIWEVHLNRLVRWASCAGPHSLGHIFVFG